MQGGEVSRMRAALRHAAAGACAGGWLAAVLTLHDLAAMRPDSLPWSGAWRWLGEAVLVGALFYALPFALLLALAGLAAGLAGVKPRPAAPVAVSLAVTLGLAYVAAGALPRAGKATMLSALGLLELMLILAVGALAGWGAGRAAAWACRRESPAVALGVLALLPVLPALPALPGLLMEAGSPWKERPAPRSASLPDVFVIVADTLRADRLNGARGEEIMPAVRRLAQAGTRYSRATAHSSWTNPSTATILTGLLPVDHGMRGYGGAIRPGVRSLALILEELGYETAGITANPLVSSSFGFDRGFHHWDEEPVPGLLQRHGFTFAARLRRAMGLAPPDQGTMTATEMTDRALAILGQPRERPLFLYLHYFDPHDPYGPPAGWKPPVDPGYAGSLSFERETLYQILRGELDVDDRDIEHARALYDAEIAYMDGEIGRLLESLDERFRRGGAVIAFTSDHGEEFMEHGALGHEHTLYQELIHIPMLVARPGRVPEGRVVERPVSHLDLLPTILDAAGLPPPHELPGRSLLAAAGEAPEGVPPILGEEDYTGYRTVSHRMRSLRDGDHKVILYAPNVFGIGPWRREFYDLADDPLEARPLADLPEGADAPGGMMERLMAWKERSSQQDDRRGRLDPEAEQRLRALGYIE